MRFEFGYVTAETRPLIPGSVTFTGQPPVPCAASRLIRFVPNAMFCEFVSSYAYGG